MAGPDRNMAVMDRYPGCASARSTQGMLWLPFWMALI